MNMLKKDASLAFGFVDTALSPTDAVALEAGAYSFMMHHKALNNDQGHPQGQLVESFALTDEKLAVMGLAWDGPPQLTKWWVGARLSPAAFDEVSNGARLNVERTGNAVRAIVLGDDQGSPVALMKCADPMLAKHDDTMRRFNKELRGLYHTYPEYDTMNRDSTPVEKIQKAYEHGGSFLPADAQAGLEQEAERLQVKDPTLTDEAAIAKAYEGRVFRFREHDGERNPTWLEVIRKAAQRPERPQVRKALDEQAAYMAAFEAVADDLRKRDPRLTKESAKAAAMIDGGSGQEAFEKAIIAGRSVARARGGA